MRFMSWEVDVKPGGSVEVELSSQANVKVMDYSNFCAYRRGDAHHFYGGLAKVSPISIAVPSGGHWYVIVDLGGYSGTVNASVLVRA